jgi:endoglucanase
VQRRLRAAGLVLAAAALAIGAVAYTSSGTSGTAAGDPLVADHLAVVPADAAAAQRRYTAAGDTVDAHLVARLAAQPTAVWLTTGDAAAVRSTVRGVLTAAGTGTPVLVAYDIPDRDCGGFSSGGAADATAYASWIAAVAAGLGQASAVVVLEPDAIPDTLPQGGCAAFDSAAAESARYRMLAGAVTALSADHHAEVYLDAGNAGWITDLPALASALRSSGIAHAAGFALNVSSFFSTADSIRYGTGLSGDLGGAHFVIDTSRNGAGPYSPAAGDDQPAWCNPPGRRLGPAPTTSTGNALVDAYLWVKIPGQSDGTCRGGPAAGVWWASYALALVRDSPPAN